MTTPDVLVLGGGLVGLATALATATRGLRVTLISTPRAGEASPAAAGILAPTLEHAAEAQDNPAHIFALAARDRYPEFLQSLADRTGINVPLDRSGILEVALDDDSLVAMASRAGDRGFELLDRRALIALEPALASCAGAVLHPLDGSVDNVALIDALRTAGARSLVTVIEDAVAEVAFDGTKTVSAHLTSGERIEAAVAVLAAGAWVNGIRGLPRALPVQPVRGQMLAYSGRPVRRVVYGPNGYLVPRASEGGRTLAGATMEDVGFTATTSEEGLESMRAMAESICPVFRGQTPSSSWAGIRPVTPDLLPIIGADPDQPALLYACGHSRNGVLMSPLTGDCIAALLLGEASPHDLGPFSPQRFGHQGS